jgi:hypothetical protein
MSWPWPKEDCNTIFQVIEPAMITAIGVLRTTELTNAEANAAKTTLFNCVTACYDAFLEARNLGCGPIVPPPVIPPSSI